MLTQERTNHSIFNSSGAGFQVIHWISNLLSSINHPLPTGLSTRMDWSSDLCQICA